MSSPTTLVTWTYGTEQDGLRVEFHEGAAGVRSPLMTCTLLGDMQAAPTAEDETWNFGVSCLCSMLLIAIPAGIIQTPQQFNKLVFAYLEQLANDTP